MSVSELPVAEFLGLSVHLIVNNLRGFTETSNEAFPMFYYVM